jgi:hypothetical protein
MTAREVTVRGDNGSWVLRFEGKRVSLCRYDETGAHQRIVPLGPRSVVLTLESIPAVARSIGRALGRRLHDDD